MKPWQITPAVNEDSGNNIVRHLIGGGKPLGPPAGEAGKKPNGFFIHRDELKIHRRSK